MDLFEKINKAFGGWYEGLFGGGDDVRPKDILRKILVALEEHRKEGFDSKIYVPNQYILEIAVDDAEEKEYLLSFLDQEELEAAIRRYCGQNHYHIRGALDFTIKEVELEAEGKRREKVRVRCRYDSKLAAVKPEPIPEAREEAERLPGPPARATPPEEDFTVPEVNYGYAEEMGTVPAVAAASLTLYPPNKPPQEVSLARGVLTIGRSPRANNDVVLEEDGLVSRRHARIELDADGQFTLYDLATTNGTRVNGKRVDNRALADGDEIQIGTTRLVFHRLQDEMTDDRRPTTDDRRPTTTGGRTQGPPLPQSSVLSPQSSPRPRLVLTDGVRDIDDFVLASETVLGRGATNDIVLTDRSVATRHVLLRRGRPFTLEILDAEHLTLLNGTPITPGTSFSLKDGDRIGLGTLTLRFEEGAS